MFILYGEIQVVMVPVSALCQWEIRSSSPWIQKPWLKRNPTEGSKTTPFEQTAYLLECAAFTGSHWLFAGYKREAGNTHRPSPDVRQKTEKNVMLSILNCMKFKNEF